MKHFRSLGVIIMAVTIIMMGAASASATTLTDSAENGTPTVHLVNEKAHLELANPIVNIRCLATIEFFITAHGSGVTASGPVSVLKYSGCTDEWVVDVVNNGSITVHYTGAGSGHGVGTLTSTGFKITGTRAGLSCIYETNETPLGTLTGGNPATLAVSATIPRVGGSFLCGGSTAALSGSFVSTQTLKIHP